MAHNAAAAAADKRDYVSVCGYCLARDVGVDASCSCKYHLDSIICYPDRKYGYNPRVRLNRIYPTSGVDGSNCWKRTLILIGWTGIACGRWRARATRAWHGAASGPQVTVAFPCRASFDHFNLRMRDLCNKAENGSTSAWEKR